MTREPIFIRIPRVSESDRYIAVDTNRITNRLLTLYRRKGHNRYEPIEGETHEAWACAQLDQMVQEVDDTVTGLAQSNGCDDDLGCFIFELIESFRPLIKAIMDRDAEAVHSLIAQIMTWLTTAIPAIAQSRQEQEQTIARLEAELLTIREASVESVHTEQYIRWAEAIRELNRVCDEYLAVRGEVEAFGARVQTACSSWNSVLDPQSELIVDAMHYLDPPRDASTSEQGFIMKAQLRGPIAVQQIEAVNDEIADMRVVAGKCLSVERGVQHEYAMLNEEHGRVNGAEGPRARAEQLCDEIERCQQTLRTIEETSTTLQRPYESGIELVSREMYDRALSRLPPHDRTPHSWRSITCRAGLRALVQRASSALAAPPALPTALCEAIRDAERLATLNEQRIDSVQNKVLVRSHDRQVTVKRRVEETRPASVDEAIDATRFTELYEQLLCVGHILTSSRKFFAAVTTKSMFRILTRLGKCTEEEALAHQESMSSYIRGISEPVEGKSAAVSCAQGRSKHPWLYFRTTRGPWRRKVTDIGSAQALVLMQRYGICEGDVRAARAEIETERKRAYQIRLGREEGT